MGRRFKPGELAEMNLSDEQLDELIADVCAWVEPDLCSACAPAAASPAPALLYDAYGKGVR